MNPKVDGTTQGSRGTMTGATFAVLILNHAGCSTASRLCGDNTAE
jgi:hypothetical protein